MPPNFTAVHQQQDRDALEYIRRQVGAGHPTPTMQQIADHMGLPGSTSALRILRRLEKAGHLDMTGGHRGIKLAASPAALSVPLRGSVSCGPLKEPEDADDRLDLGAWFKRDDLTAYKASGKSMIEDGIHPGDYVFVRECPEPETGSRVLAMVGREMTLKKYGRDGKGNVILKPCNRKMQPMLFDPINAHVRILGVLQYVLRKF